MFESFEDLKKSASGQHVSKRAMREGIMKMIPPHKMYVEPFCGAARLLFAKDASGAEVLNDSDPAVTGFFSALSSLNDADAQQLLAKNWKSSKAVWKKLIGFAPTEPVEQLWKFLYTRTFSQARLGNSFDAATSGQVDATVAKRALEARGRLAKVSLESTDYAAVVAKHDSAETFFFFDVPGAPDFDRAKFCEVLKSIKGRFLVTCAPGGEAAFSGFQICKVAQRRTTITEKAEIRSEREVSQLVVTNYTAPTHKAFEGTSFEIEEPRLGTDLVTVLKRTQGGIHSHLLDRPKLETDLDGQHYHLYMLPGEAATGGSPMFFETVYDGPHRHVLKATTDEETQEDGIHRHKVRVWASYDYYYYDASSATYDTADSPGHVHELLIDSTASDGLHSHVLDVDGIMLKSLSPAEYTALELRKSDKDAAPYYDVPAAGSGSRLAAVKARVLKNGSTFLDLWIDNGVKAVGWTFGAAAHKIELTKAEDLVERSSLMGDRLFPSLLTKANKVHELGALDSHFLLVDGDVDGGKVVHLSDCVVEHGLHTRGAHEYFFAKNDELAGVLDVIFDHDGSWKARLRKDNLVPAVLSARARAEKWMPPEGTSGMPSTLETLVPEELRFWLHSGDRAIELRDALIDAQFITKSRLAIVNGEIRMIEKSVALYKMRTAPDLASDWPVKKLAEHSQLTIQEQFGVAGAAAAESDAAFFDLTEQDAEQAKASLKKLAESGREYAAMLTDSEQTRALAGSAFKFVPEFPEHALEITKRLFVASFALPRSSAIEWVGKSAGVDVLRSFVKKDAGESEFSIGDRVTALTPHDATHSAGTVTQVMNTYAYAFQPDGSDDSYFWYVEPELDAEPAGVDTAEKRAARATQKLQKFLPKGRQMAILKTDEERYVLGIVLEPETEDSQSDIYSADEVRKAAHDFMANFQNIGLMHRTIINGKAQILESYLAPATFKIDGQSVKKGTWLFGVRVSDDDLWAEVKDGGLTGFSIGGSAVRTPEK